LEARSAGDFLIFRNAPSWGRQDDFENVLVELGCNYEQRKSSAMAAFDQPVMSQMLSTRLDARTQCSCHRALLDVQKRNP